MAKKQIKVGHKVRVEFCNRKPWVGVVVGVADDATMRNILTVKRDGAPVPTGEIFIVYCNDPFDFNNSGAHLYAGIFLTPIGYEPTLKKSRALAKSI